MERPEVQMKGKPDIQDIIDNLLDGCPRDLAKYVRQGQRPQNKHGYYNTNLAGNIGRLFVTGNNQFDCLNWIAGSPNADKEVREEIHKGRLDLKYVGSLPDSNQLYFCDRSGPLHIFAEEYPPIQKGQDDDDSEYLLINALAHSLKEFGIVQGEAYLLTERIPCASCTHVINRFLTEFPAFNMRIYFLFDSPKRGIDEFLAGSAHPARIDATYINFASEQDINAVGPW
jgi:hypothetical protein